VSLIASLVLLAVAVLPRPSSAWNIPGHMLSGIIAFQILQRENPQTIDKVKAVLEKHPWYANQARLQDLPVTGRWAMIFAGMTSKRRRSISNLQTAVSCLSQVRNCSSRNRSVSNSLIPASRNRCERVFMPFIEVRGSACSNPGPI
jgi:hypothetical protein